MYITCVQKVLLWKFETWIYSKVPYFKNEEKKLEHSKDFMYIPYIILYEFDFDDLHFKFKFDVNL